MKKIVPFKKELSFKTNLSEITSISLEHSLHLSSENLITGSFNITGDYKIADTSINTESFSFELPFDINIDDKYVVDNVVVDIDDFYYEIVDNKILSVNIDVLIDKLEEKPLVIKEVIEQPEINLESITKEDRCYDEDDEFPFKEIENLEVKVSKEKEEKKNESNNEIKSLFDNFNDSSETYSMYKVYIIRENDNIDSIIQKYSITKEDLLLYNDINDLKIGDKLIIPNINNEKN